MSRTTGTTEGRRTPSARGSGDALRQEILSAARELAAESGDLGTITLRSIARRVGVAATSIYLHFPDLDALQIALKHQMYDELSDMLRTAAAAAGTDPADRLRAVAHQYVRFGLDQPNDYRVLFTPVRKHPQDPAIGYIGQQAMEGLVVIVAEFLGIERDDPVALMLAIHVWTSMHGLVHLRGNMRNFPWPDLTAEVDSMMDRLLTGRG